jgi:hypothetical protein
MGKDVLRYYTTGLGYSEVVWIVHANLPLGRLAM